MSVVVGLLNRLVFLPTLQAYVGRGRRARLVTAYQASIPTTALWQHLGYTHDLPWSLGLRVEVDGVLGDEVHQVVMRSWREGNVSTYVSCVAAFRPLVGKQYVAWRFMWPDTLVCAVGTSAAEAEGDDDDEEEEEEVEQDERCGGDDAGARVPPPSTAPQGPQAQHAGMTTIKVTGMAAY